MTRTSFCYRFDDPVSTILLLHCMPCAWLHGSGMQWAHFGHVLPHTLMCSTASSSHPSCTRPTPLPQRAATHRWPPPPPRSAPPCSQQTRMRTCTALHLPVPPRRCRWRCSGWPARCGRRSCACTSRSICEGSGLQGRLRPVRNLESNLWQRCNVLTQSQQGQTRPMHAYALVHELR